MTDRINTLKHRIAAWDASAKELRGYAASCRRAACLKSAEHWDREAEKAEAFAMMARNELEGLS